MKKFSHSEIDVAKLPKIVYNMGKINGIAKAIGYLCEIKSSVPRIEADLR